MSNHDLSQDTQVVLLLCGRFGGEKQDPFQPLSAREYGELAKWLLSRNLRPSDLMASTGREALSDVHESRLEPKRIDFLLGRGATMALAVERWTRAGLWVTSRADVEFPKRLRRHLKHATPPLLYGAGDKGLLDLGGLAIIGSRDASESALEYTRATAQCCANEGLAVVSGGARGVDAAAMQGVTEAGGKCIGVLASDLLKTSFNRQNRLGLEDGRLVLVSPFFPEAGFNAGNAMGRNRYIYTLAEQALVIDSALRSGGTWEGAIENLRNGWVPMYVRSPGEGAGNAALISEGGRPFTFTHGSDESLREFLTNWSSEATSSSDFDATTQSSLLEPTAAEEAAAEVNMQLASCPAVDVSLALGAVGQPKAAAAVADVVLEQSAGSAVASLLAVVDAKTDTIKVDEVSNFIESSVVGETSSMDMYSDFLVRLAALLKGVAMSEEEIASHLCIEKGQAKVWLKRASEDGTLEKLKKPVRYALGRQGSLC